MIKTIKFGCLTCTTSGVLANPTAVNAGMATVAPTTNTQALTLAGTPVEKSLSFIYGPEHQRIKQVAIGGPNPGTTWYLNGEDSLGLSYEKEQKGTGITEHKHYLQAGGITFAMHTMRHSTVGGTIAAPALPAATATVPAVAPYTTSYLHHDQLGSIIAITDPAGAVVERLAYDPWGKRRFVNGKPDTLDAITGKYIDRGFTMHEHMDEMGIINMNGRIYDPLIGRFMSADPTIPNPRNLQSFNRYAYVLNNPLRLTDPSGFSDDGGTGDPVDPGPVPGCDVCGTTTPPPLPGSPPLNPPANTPVPPGSSSTQNPSPPATSPPTQPTPQPSAASQIPGATSQAPAADRTNETMLQQFLDNSYVREALRGLEGIPYGFAIVGPVKAINALSKAEAVATETKAVLSVVGEAPRALAEATSRIIVGSDGVANVFIKGVEMSVHAAEQASKRGITISAIENTMTSGQTFVYFQKGQTLQGFYDSVKNIFLGVGDRITTVMQPKNPTNYIKNVQNRAP